jgi:aspartate aminotransferase-like enzyme
MTPHDMSPPDMSQFDRLLDVAPVTAADYASIEDRCRAVIGTAQTTFVFQGEAIVALEAVARGLGRPGGRALNLISGPYGSTIGDWLAQAGSTVENVTVPFDRAIGPELVEAALDRLGAVDVVTVVHAEAATGVVNDLAALARVARSHGALVAVDAVASIGAEQLAVDAWGLDVVVMSAQKALAGPAGVSVLAMTPAAWAALDDHPSPWRGSVLSLLDWRDRWIGSDRAVLPSIPSHLETRALGAAMGRVADEGLEGVVARHRAAGAATRAALEPLGLVAWAQRPGEAASVATVVRAPAEGSEALAAAAALTYAARTAGPMGFGGLIAVAPGPLARDAFRVNHTGRRANLAAVLMAVAELAESLRALGHQPDLGTALAVAAGAWRDVLAAEGSPTSRPL